MKTTVDLPDDLLIQAKKRSAELRRPLRSLIEEGLRLVLQTGPSKRPVARKKIRWLTVKGDLPPGLNLRDRAQMHDWIRRSR
jgi:hypothetical protein